MARPIRNPEEWGRNEIHKAAGRAAAILLGQLEDCRAAMRTCLKIAEASKTDSDYAEQHINLAVRLAMASARLADALARARGETLQNIRVERGAPELGDTKAALRSHGPITPVNAPNKGL